MAKLISFEPVLENGVHKSYTTAHGTFYNFIVEFDNGDKGSTSSKKQQPSWKTNEDYTYEKVQNGNYTNIKSMKPVNGFNSKTPQSNAGFALSYAKDYAVANISVGKEFKGEHIIALANVFKAWLDEN